MSQQQPPPRPASTPMMSLTEHVVPLDTGAYAIAAAFIDNTPVFALGDGHVLVVGDEGPARHVAHPDGTILNAVSDGKRIITGADDGRVVATVLSGAQETLGDEKGRWIDSLAISANGATAWSVARKVAARDDKGRISRWEAKSSVRGLAFAPKGYRLACAHYDGVSLWYPGTQTPPDLLDWKGSHIDVAWSRDSRFVITTMQENALHGWRLQPDKGHMRMTGYPGKTRSLSWSHDGNWLATSGAEAVIIWPFDTKDGPMGKAPRECGVRHSRVTSVAFHPHVYVVAAGYDDGAILLLRLTDASELLVRKPGEGGAVTAMAWDSRGARLAFGCAEGAAGVLTLPA